MEKGEGGYEGLHVSIFSTFAQWKERLEENK